MEQELTQQHHFIMEALVISNIFSFHLRQRVQVKELDAYKEKSLSDDNLASHAKPKVSSTRHSIGLKDSLQNTLRPNQAIPEAPQGERKPEFYAMPNPTKMKTPKERQRGRIPIVTSEKKSNAKPKSDDISTASG